MAESTLVLLKPDARQRNLVGEVLGRIEDEGFSLDAVRTVEPTADLLAEHYREHVDAEFYDGLVEYMREPPGVVAVAVSGENAADRIRDLAGDTEPASADPGTIRGDLGDDSYDRADAEGRGLRNLVHASEPDEAERELELWFGEDR